ncbi:DEAD/DEAH box helicase [Marinilabiliaceae bacterium JC040]|nr:DEAD/DEAH box helicase [Marinilabiliaceae bacterium JC040]
MFLKRLYQPLERAITESHLEEPISKQKDNISAIKSGRDVVYIDKEEQGKSTAIAISVINKLKEEFEDVPRAMIIVPDKEEGEKLEECFSIYGKYTSLRVHTAYETRLIEDQRDEIYFGTDILIGTVKQINKLYAISGINITGVKIFIIDNSDKVITDANQSEVERICESLPKCQKILVGTKINSRVERIIDQHMLIY